MLYEFSTSFPPIYIYKIKFCSLVHLTPPMPVVLSVYGGLGLGLALNPTPNPYRKPRAMSYPPLPICGAGVPDEHNKAIPTHNVINTHTHTHLQMLHSSHTKEFESSSSFSVVMVQTIGILDSCSAFSFVLLQYGFSGQYL